MEPQDKKPKKKALKKKSQEGKKTIEIDDYALLKKLGRGVTATVYLARDIKEEHIVALKVFNGRQSFEARSRAWKVEIEALSKIEHPNITKLLKYKWDTELDGKSAPIIAYELAPNNELLDYLLFTGSFSEEVARTYFLQLMSVLKTTHEAGITHRDLKPDNILLGKDFELKVADFGFASMHNAMTTYTGTTSYMAPEIIEVRKGKRKSYTGAVDIWSAGVILFIMMNAGPPYALPRKGDFWFDRIKAEEWKIFWKSHEHQRKFPSDFKELIQKMLKYDPEGRATIKQILESKWVKGRKILQKSELIKELERKKPVVDEEKKREELMKKSDSGDSQVMRAIVLERTGIVKSVKLTKPNIDKKLLPVPPTYEEPFLKCYTTVDSPHDAKEALVKVVALLGSAGVQCTRDNFTIDAHWQAATGPVNFGVEVFSVGSKSRMLVRRRGGNWLSFREIYGFLKKKI
mmetsp:Transcript_7585/g.11482  ORF Transcript_7585/g.11482 Transcript_7585/m.11482 type:complete len:461 (+) Transcript_7585:20-1402(+)